MKRILLALLLCTSLTLSGCAYGQTGIDGMLKPPKLSDQQNEIYAALQASVGKNITLKYPRTGDFTSAFLLANIDEEQTQEAIVFYENTDTVNATMNLRINVLDQTKDGWVSVYDAGVSAADVDKVNFIQSNGNTFLVIGFNLSGNTEKLVVVYRYQDGQLEETAQRITCLDYVACNLNKDGYTELFAISLDVKSGRRMAQAYQISSQGSARPMGRTDMDPNVSSYRNIVIGDLAAGRQAVYLDGVSGTNRYTTEILVYDGGNIQNLLYSPAEELSYIDETARNHAVFSADIDADGIVEIPTRVVASGYENAAPHEREYFTRWNICTENGLLVKKTSYVAYTLGFLFTLPDEWIGRVTPVFSSADSELTFYRYDAGMEPTARLLSIRVFKRSEFREGLSGYTTLRNNGQIIYAQKFYSDDASLVLRSDTVQACFSLYTQ